MRDDSTNGQLEKTPAPATRAYKPLPKMFAGLPVRQPREIRQYRGWSTVLSGRGGVGKTTEASKIVNSEICWNTIFVDIEGGAFILDDAEDRPRYKPEEGPHLGIVEVKNWSELNMCMEYLITQHKAIGINSAIFDNMGEAIELCKIKHNFYQTDKKYRLSLWDDITNDMIQLFRKGRDLARQEQFVCVFVSWDTERLIDPDDSTGGHKRDLSINPKSAEKVMGIMDSCIWLETPQYPKPAHPAILHYTDIRPDIPTKKRINPKQQRAIGIPDIVYNPDLGVIVDSILGGQKFPIENHTDKPSARNMQEILASRKAAPGAPGASSGTNQ